jgi:ribose transport system substrate-binding protein
VPSITLRPRYWRRGAALAAAALMLAACSSSTSSSTSSSSTNSASTSNSKHLTIAYLSFAVENSYDAPMLAAAEAVASDNNATLKVFDANNSPQTQYSQLQDVITSGQYDGIILQPIFGTGLISLVQQGQG